MTRTLKHPINDLLGLDSPEKPFSKYLHDPFYFIATTKTDRIFDHSDPDQ